MPSLRDMITAKSKVAGGKPPVTKGLRLSDAGEPEGNVSAAREVLSPLTDRQMDSTAWDGQEVPMDYPSESSSHSEKLFWQARHCTDRHLVVWVQDEDWAWLAVNHASGGPLILISRFPRSSNPGVTMPF
jgi:hypothetical protein